MAMVTTLFFMWGFLTALNDILIPHLKAIFDLNYTWVMLINSAFFGGYFVFAIPSGKLIEKIGYKKTMVVGLLVMAVGAVLFVPAANVPSFALFLAALIVLAAELRRCRWPPPIRDRAWPGAHRFQPSEPYPGFQFAGNHDRPGCGRVPDSRRPAGGPDQIAATFRIGAAASPATGSLFR